MANHKSAIKRHKQSEKRRQRNATVKSELRTASKKVIDAVKNNDLDYAQKQLAAATSLLDSAVTKGVLHRNNASRRVSRLKLAVNAATTK